MSETPFSMLDLVHSDQIDASDDLFRITISGLVSNQALKASIRQAGILVPLRLHPKTKGRFRIISGFRRFELGLKSGLTEFPAVIVPAENNALSLFREAILEKTGERDLRELEKAVIIGKLADQFGLSPDLIIGSYLKLLALKPSNQNYLRYQKIAQLPDYLIRAICSQGVLENQAIRLVDWEKRDALFITRRIEHYRLGVNKQKKLIDLCEELKKIQESDVLTLWKISGAEAVEEKLQSDPVECFQKVLRQLYRLRYPTLSAYEEEFKQLRSTLRLPSQISLTVPEYFEGNRITLTLKVSSAQELEDLGEKLKLISSTPQIRKILNLL